MHILRDVTLIMVIIQFDSMRLTNETQLYFVFRLHWHSAVDSLVCLRFHRWMEWTHVPTHSPTVAAIAPAIVHNHVVINEIQMKYLSIDAPAAANCVVFRRTKHYKKTNENTNRMLGKWLSNFPSEFVGFVASNCLWFSIFCASVAESTGHYEIQTVENFAWTWIKTATTSWSEENKIVQAMIERSHQ